MIRHWTLLSAGLLLGVAIVVALHLSLRTAALLSSPSTAALATTPVTRPRTGSRTTAAETVTTTTASPATVSVVGTSSADPYGTFGLKVTFTGTKITAITLVEQPSDAHSQQITSAALGQLNRQALAAQSAKIDGVSGATYTTEAYKQSLQAAIDQVRS
jgi:uncharacterized protein with FMN-binding domain